MQTKYLHILAAPGGANSLFDLMFVEDFAVVCGQNAAGNFIHPTTDDKSYLAPCGVQGLKYMADLGLSGSSKQFRFPELVDRIIVATYSTVAPTPEVLVASTPELVSFTQQATFLRIDPAGSGTAVKEYVLRCVWSRAGTLAETPQFVTYLSPAFDTDNGDPEPLEFDQVYNTLAAAVLHKTAAQIASISRWSLGQF